MKQKKPFNTSAMQQTQELKADDPRKILIHNLAQKLAPIFVNSSLCYPRQNNGDCKEYCIKVMLSTIMERYLLAINNEQDAGEFCSSISTLSQSIQQNQVYNALNTFNNFCALFCYGDPERSFLWGIWKYISYYNRWQASPFGIQAILNIAQCKIAQPDFCIILLKELLTCEHLSHPYYDLINNLINSGIASQSANHHDNNLNNINNTQNMSHSYYNQGYNNNGYGYMNNILSYNGNQNYIYNGNYIPNTYNNQNIINDMQNNEHQNQQIYNNNKINNGNSIWSSKLFLDVEHPIDSEYSRKQYEEDEKSEESENNDDISKYNLEHNSAKDIKK
ncbi:MAG: hypothetical protein IJT15_01265 [Rickettsiales bacterium]|nr:hypothetical protein [Rickettsiales bacterium]